MMAASCFACGEFVLPAAAAAALAYPLPTHYPTSHLLFGRYASSFTTP